MKFHLFVWMLGFGSAHAFSQQLQKMAALPSIVKESSGLVSFTDSSFLTINDSGNEAKLYEISKKGNLLSVTSFNEEVENYDWEELQRDEQGNVYIGDIGNNLNLRNILTIYFMPAESIGGQNVRAKRIDFHYPEQLAYPPANSELHYDAEAFLIWGDEIILFTKCRTDPFSGQTRIYAIPKTPGRHVAKWIGTVVIGTQSWREHSVTAACKYNGGIALLTYAAWYEVKLFDPRAKFWVNGNVIKHNLPFYRQREAISQGRDGKIYLTDEKMPILGGGNLYQWIGKKQK
jgi:hypothetical protein